MIYTEDERALIWLDSFIGLTKEQKLRILKSTNNPAIILKDISLIKDFCGKNLKEEVFQKLKASLELNMHNQAVDDLNALGVVAVTCMSDNYPEKFLEIPDPPLVIYCKGNLELLKAKPIFSIVGSRKTLPVIVAKAEDFSKELAENGVVIVTGLAEGVDVSAIKGALPSGNIVSILPGGFRHVYPEFHKSIFDEIAKKGLVISEYYIDVESKRYHFPERNRLLAAFSDGVLVCSAGKKSGTNYTADFANSYGKNVFAFPYTLGVPSGEGCNAMIKEFAMLCDSTDDIFTSLRITKNKKKKAVSLTDNEIKVYNSIIDGETHIDLIIEKTGLSLIEVSPALTLLEIKKFIVKNPGNTYSVIK